MCAQGDRGVHGIAPSGERDPRLNERGYPNYVADDGWRARLLDVQTATGEATELEVSLVHGRETLRRFKLQVYPGSKRVDTAERDLHLVAAYCRYLNAGGSARHADNVLRQLLDATYEDAFRLPPGWELLMTSQEVAEAQHTFVHRESGKVLVMSEDQFTEETTLAELTGMPELDPEIVDVPHVQHSPGALDSRSD